jgi:hypothetical protein
LQRRSAVDKFGHPLLERMIQYFIQYFNHPILHIFSYIVISSTSNLTFILDVQFCVLILSYSFPGMDVDMFEGKSLIVYLVCEKGLTADWNAAHPESPDSRGGHQKWWQPTKVKKKYLLESAPIVYIYIYI